MERGAGAGAGGGDPASALRSLVKGRPSRLLAIGWDEAPDLTPFADQVVSCPDSTTAADGQFDAVLWATDAAALDAAALSRVRRLLGTRARLTLWSAAGGDTTVRGLVRALSENGFVILKELDAEALGGAALVARRDDFVIRPYQDGDGAAVRRLFQDSFHVERGEDHWRWKYHENPYGNRYVSLALAPEGELAAHYGGYPMPFWCDGRTFNALQMSDTMTGPAFRHVGRGTSSLLARTVRHFFAVHRWGPFGFFYGFNTGGIQRFCRWFIGGSRVEPVRYRVRELRGGRPAPGSGYRVERVWRAGAAWNRFFRRVAASYGFLARRDAAYVDWRYLRCPDDAPYVVLAAYRWRRLVGWSVFRRREGRLVWGDALFDPRHAGAAEAVLATALDQGELAGASAVEGWFPDRPSWWDAELTRLGFESRPQPDDLGFMILPDTEQDPPLERLYYTMGDGDLF